MNVEKIKASQLIYLGLPMFPAAVAILAMVVYVPTYYAVDLEMGLATVGIIFAINRIIDVFTDPAIGFLSDRTKGRFGPRKPWIAVGLPMLTFAAWLLFNPPANPSAGFLFFACTVYYLGLTLYFIPFAALALEISDFEHERSLLIGIRVGFHITGTLLAAVLPVVLAITPAAALPLLAKIVSVAMLPALLLFLWRVPVRSRGVSKAGQPIHRVLVNTLKIPGMRGFLRPYILLQVYGALTSSLLILFLTYVLKAPEEQVGLFVGLIFITALPALPVWYFISKKIGKYETWIAGILIKILALCIALCVREGDFGLAQIASVFFGLGSASGMIMASSILADIIYREEQKNKKRLGGLVASVTVFFTKAAIIIPMGIAFPILGWAGISKGIEASNGQIWLILLFYAVIPIGLGLAAAALLFAARKDV